ncbi:MAG TPA: ribosome-associated translation inhibitor RaiA [Cyclobacteriaceae bacterium]|jgi:putative sigma-54 modulation protein|nr:ribosome-associated translation inhibitor RaiA [Cyclobacteriaceae bacterium]
MKVKMQSVHFNADGKLLAYVQKKVNKLETFYDRITGGEVIMKLDNDGQNQNKIVEFIFNIPGDKLFVKERSRTFEAATDLAIDRLKRQIKKYKQKKIGR